MKWVIILSHCPGKSWIFILQASFFTHPAWLIWMPKALLSFQGGIVSPVSLKRGVFTWDSLEGVPQNLRPWEGVTSIRHSASRMPAAVHGRCSGNSREVACEAGSAARPASSQGELLCQPWRLLEPPQAGLSTASPCWPSSNPWSPEPQPLDPPTSSKAKAHHLSSLPKMTFIQSPLVWDSNFSSFSFCWPVRA